ncbi:type III-B CRISPR module RAMP protein Cmr6 [Thiomicrospira sp. R3]|uniref:type III-B CRISPR module RAMP protein Cmr6 n=1 Tax=Thiomicrospira sp. R3 TaxID=3035472 RepID=UPI00259B0E47|nr:type III-B CRISPR module RAMP protein Cmr6 [Thiomicrospira sp. R3]WFE68507.1 type III-B CRISPR module RAMP protein Cmr6 [Thiomicrospira sp. R3]
MNFPLYRADHPNKRHNNGHAGLFFQKFFDGFNADFSDFTEKETTKRHFLDKFSGGQGDNAALNQACFRQIELVEQLGGQWFVVSTAEASRFVTGLGNLHPVENGFLWHHTLATPYMQGSAIKGILRSWLEIHLGYGADDSTDKQQDFADLKRYFGSETKSSQNNQAGQLVFFDAIPIERPQLKTEVMTPHLGNYYAQGEKNPGQADTIPADWHSPTPIPFLVVDKASFLISIAPRMTLPSEDKQKISEELADLATALKNALANIGAGAKTATGFGRLCEDEKAFKDLNDVWQAQKNQQARSTMSAEALIIQDASELVASSPAQTLMPGQSNYIKFIELIKQSADWTIEERSELMERVVTKWLVKTFTDKKKQKENKKKFVEKHPWLKLD